MPTLPPHLSHWVKLQRLVPQYFFIKYWYGVYACDREKGPAKANEMLMLGRKLSPKDAVSLGFVNEIFPDGDLFTKALEIAKEIALLPPQALAESKLVICKLILIFHSC